jgi:predicted anti-sigma-YlaC factor YlaD
VACERWREAISAIVDGEDPGIDARLVAAHLDRCPECCGFQAIVEEQRRSSRIGAARPGDDVARRVTSVVAVADRASRSRTVRVLLGVVAVEIIVFSLPALVAGHRDGSTVHDGRHLAAFTMAYGVGLLVVVARPARARTMLPVAAVLAGALLITAIVDLADGAVPLVGEAQHLADVVSVALIWLLTAPTTRREPRRRRSRHGETRLSVVGDERRAG